jgi:glycosyltransferase 2 family protein
MRFPFDARVVSWRGILLGYFAAGFLLLAFFSKTDWAAVAAGLRGVAWPLLGMAVVLRLAALLTSAARWRILLLPVRNVGPTSTIAAVMAGMAVTAAISMPAAEFVRPYLLSKREHIPFPAVFSTVAVEWPLDLIAVLALFIPATFLQTAHGETAATLAGLNRGLALAVLICVAGCAGLWFVHRRAADIRGLLLRRGGRLPKSITTVLARQFEHFANGLSVIGQPTALMRVCGCSLLIVSLDGTAGWLALNAFGLQLPVVAAFLVPGLAALGGLLPTPAAAGGFHAVCQFGLLFFFAVDLGRAVLPVVGLHAVLYMPPALIGAFCLLLYAPRMERALDS